MDQPSKEFLEGLGRDREMEQTDRAIRNLAHMVHRYHEELQHRGFNAIQALTLTVNYQQSVIQASTEGKK